MKSVVKKAKGITPLKRGEKVHKILNQEFIKNLESIQVSIKNGEDISKHLNWIKGWVVNEPKNGASGRVYHPLGYNAFLLSFFGNDSLYFTRNWIKKSGGAIRKDKEGKQASGFPIQFWKWNERTIFEDGKDVEVKGYPVLMFYKVWGLSDITGIDKKILEKYLKKGIGYRKARGKNKIATTWLEFAKSELDMEVVHNNGNGAYYTPSSHKITMPKEWKSNEGYWETLCHEAIHWASKGCGVDLGKSNKGTKAYAREELVAELGTCMLCGLLGIDITLDRFADNIKAYCSSWLKAVANEPDVLYLAHKEAVKRVNFLTEKLALLEA